MDRQVIDQKLESLFRCLSRIKAKFPADVSLLTSDFDLQDIVSLNLSRAVQLTVDIGGHIVSVSDFHSPETMGQTFDVLAQNNVVSHDLAARLKKSVGFRNIAVHNYDAINWHIVHSIIKDHLGDFAEFAKAVITWQNQQR
jgi:uncharacterized protein YutE (UPF0331/DUF86 family)